MVEVTKILGWFDIGYLINYLILSQSLKIILYHLNWGSISIIAHFLHFNTSKGCLMMHISIMVWQHLRTDIRRYTQRKRAALQVIQQTLINYRQFLHYCNSISVCFFICLFFSPKDINLIELIFCFDLGMVLG